MRPENYIVSHVSWRKPSNRRVRWSDSIFHLPVVAVVKVWKGTVP